MCMGSRVGTIKSLFFPFSFLTHRFHPSLSSSSSSSFNMLRSIAREIKLGCKNGTRLHSITPPRRLEGKVALITGGASGLGRATAREFIRNGAHVIIADIDTVLGPQVAEDLGPQAHFTPCDVSDEAQIATAVDTAIAFHGKLDVMHNNAGITGPILPPGVADIDLAEFDRVFKVNVRGTVLGVKHAARVMGPARSGSILCTASISGVVGGLGPHAYSASKAAILGVMRSAAAELCGVGVRINCISPGLIATPLSVCELVKMFPGATAEHVREIFRSAGELKGATCEDTDVANAAVYLASDEAKYVTGHNLVVDGGFTCFKTPRLPHPDQFSQS